MNCPDCGATVGEEDLFCGECGCSLAKEQPTGESLLPEEAKEQAGKWHMLKLVPVRVWFVAPIAEPKGAT
jgi:uncharacterized membrane protein YvbJ